MRRGTPPTRMTRVTRTARRMWPIALEAWRRWDRLSPQEKERYRRMVSEYAEKARSASRRRRP